MNDPLLFRRFRYYVRQYIFRTLVALGKLCFVLTATGSGAQIPAYLHYGVEEGLPGNLVYCGIQDRRGLLWFGTDKGLACFDGTRFRTLGVKDGLTDPEVLNLMEDSAGRLWISSYRKKPCYRKNGHFVTEKQDSLLANMQVQSVLWEFYEDADQSVWLSGQSPEVLHFTGKKFDYKAFERGIVRPGRIGKTLFFFGNTCIYQQHPNGELTIVQNIEVTHRPDINPFMGLSISGNRVLYAYADKLLLLEWSDGRFSEVDRRPGPIGRVFTDKHGRFWICSLDEGAVCFDNDQRDLSNPKHYFKGEKVTAMFDDRQGTQWFCTTNNGVYALPKHVAVNFTKRTGFLSNNITALARNNDGQLWSGDDEGHLYECGPDGGFRITTFGSIDGYNRVRRILPAPGDSRWIVTDELLYYERGHSRRAIQMNVSPKTALLQPGRLWCASSGALIMVDEKTFFPLRMADGRFTALNDDSQGYVWAGTNEGLLCQSDSFQFDWADSFPVLKGRMVAIEKAGKDSFWIVTPEKGLMLARVQAGKVISVDVVPERINAQLENIQSIFSAPGDYLWLATNRGVYRLDKSRKLVRFDHNNGLANDDVNAVLTYGDTLWAATVGGLSRLVLRSDDAIGDFATLIVTASYRIKDRTIRLNLLDSVFSERKIIIPPNASLFEIALTGLDYRSRGNLHYECITTKSPPGWQWWTFDNVLDWVGSGFKVKPDTTWVDTDNLSFGVNLPPGCYRLQITAVNAGGIRSLQPDFWTIEMRPYRYDTAWFWLFMWGLFAYMVWRIVRARNAFRKLDATVSELQLQALQSQINPHFIGNSINAIQQFFYPPDPVRASEFIALFTRLLRRTLSYSDQTFISFAEEEAYVRDYLEMMKLRFSDYFQYEISGAEGIPPDTPFPSMLLQPILENATLHGLAPEGISLLKLDFAISGKKLICTVTDNGAGLSVTRERQKAAGSTRQSKGLEMLYKKVETFNRRYNLGLQLELQDLSDTVPPQRGTRAVIRFFPGKIPVATPSPASAPQQTSVPKHHIKPVNPI